MGMGYPSAGSPKETVDRLTGDDERGEASHVTLNVVQCEELVVAGVIGMLGLECGPWDVGVERAGRSGPPRSRDHIGRYNRPLTTFKWLLRGS